jgi:beta-lactam-binding protein with PASTA domain/tRNA A-37 threonylcarbamoyl transferase component Bud32
MEPVDTPRIYSGRYELTHLIARGGMAQVYRAMDRQLERPVALKVLFPELSIDRTFVERFRREAQAAANLSHPNIVPVFDWGEDDGSYFIVMEYVEGRPLSAVLRDPQRMPPRQIATIGAGVAAALAFAHRHGVVHRDVKPGNVLITPDGDVKVTDFGIARAMNTEESLTQTGAVMGTAAYFSPEQAEGKGVDSRSDIYSLGVVLYEMAVGRPPFTGDSPVAVASKHVRDMPVLPREANPTVPPALEAVIMKAMAKNPDDRYGSAEELRADLLRFADGRPVEAGDPGLTSVMATVAATQAVPMTTGRTMAVPAGAGPPTSREDEERKKRTRNLIILLVILLVALAVIAFFLLRSVGVFGGNVTVPDVSNQSVAAATQTLQNDNLTVGTQSKQASTTIASGNVISTDPKVGASVAKNSTVDLVVSSGPPVTVTVPDVTGKQLTVAIGLLQAENLQYTVHNVTSNQPVGTVLSSNPKAGQKIPQTEKVALTVSGTQSTASVPSVIGQSPSHAGSILAQAGLAVGSQSTGNSCSGQATGLVSAQNPAAGQTVPANTPVNLILSPGQCVPVPGVVGQSQGAATSAITGAGLVANTTFDTGCPGGAQPGNVDSQSPAANAQVSGGSTVTISVCQTATTTTVAPTTATSTTTTVLTPPTTAGPDRVHGRRG